MSQRSFLDDVLLWDKEECRRQCSVALPKIIDCAEKEKCTLDIIHLILHNFATVCEPSDLQNIIFGKLARKISCRYDNIFEEVNTMITEQQVHVKEIQQTVLSKLQAAVSIVEGLELCIREALLKCTNVEISHVHSLLPTAVHLIHTSYEHCKESSSVYTDLLSSVSEQLSVLFKKVHSLQMTFLNLLDKLTLSSASPDCDLEDVAQVIVGLHSIGQVATHLDIKITVTVWKAVSRLACQHKAVLQDKIDYSPILISLCTDMTTAFDYLVQLIPLQTQEVCGDDKAFMKNIKILGFQMKILVKFVDEFGSELSVDCIKKIYSLMMHIQRLSPPSLQSRQVSRVHLDEIQKHLSNGIEPLVKKQLAHPTFIQCVTAVRQDQQDQSGLSWCLMLLSVVDSLLTQPVHIQARWISPEYQSQYTDTASIIEAIFQALIGCYVELSIPVTVPATFCAGEPQREVNLYEFVCTKLCALVAAWPAQYFNVVEKCLLQQVLQPVTLNALMAIDVWCFMARYGTAVLCRDHCLFLTRLLLRDGLTATPQCCHLLVLLRRLLKFLAPEHHSAFVEIFSPSDAASLPLWCVFPLHAFPGALCVRVVQELVGLTTQHVHTYTDSPAQSTAQNTLTLDLCVRCMTNITGNPFVTESSLSTTHSTEISETSVKLLELFQQHREELHTYTVLQQCAANLLCLMASLPLDNPQVHKVLEFTYDVLKESKQRNSNYDVVKVSALQFVKSLSKKRFPPTTKQSEVLHLLPRLFTAVLSDPNPVLRTEALQVFAQFAEETAHESVVTDSLSSDAELQQRVVTHLNKLANTKTVESPDIEILKKEKAEQERFYKEGCSVLYPPVVWPPESAASEPSSKRIKLDKDSNINEAELATAVHGLKDNVSKIERILHKNQNGIPDWAKTELRHCQNVLSHLL